MSKSFFNLKVFKKKDKEDKDKNSKKEDLSHKKSCCFVKREETFSKNK